jgi:CcmD family protein
MPDTFPSLFWSYTVVWGVLAAYIWTLGARVSKLEKLASRLEEDNDGGASGTGH